MGADKTVLAVTPDLRELVIQPKGNVTVRGFGTDLVIAPTDAQVLDATTARCCRRFRS